VLNLNDNFDGRRYGRFEDVDAKAYPRRLTLE
jgi:hypothetical protein